MSRIDCISNRNIKIIATYLMSRLGHYETLFDNLSFPTERYATPDDFFLNEDEWTSYDIFQTVFRRAKEMSNEQYFYFNCGSSSANLRSWGRFHLFAMIFVSPDEGFKRLPFFNKNFNDIKEIEIVSPPSYDRTSRKMRVILKVSYHDDFDGQQDYISDPYRRGLVSSIPTLWGLSPAMIKQRLNPYDPLILLNEEPEFAHYHFEASMVGDDLTIRHPSHGYRMEVGKKVLLEPDLIHGKQVFVGRYTDITPEIRADAHDRLEAVMITQTVTVDNQIILKAGELYHGPYFILDVKYDRISLLTRLARVMKIHWGKKDSESGLIETINRLRETMEARNEAYHSLAKAHDELSDAKKTLEEYNKSLEQRVQERTSELNKAKEELVLFNRDLEAKVQKQVEELKRYSDLRRYLSPKLTDKILSAGNFFGGEPQRKMMTVMFTDIRNFSSLTESLEPEELFYLLDHYLTEMTKLIYSYDATLNKIIGDGMLLFLGDPIPQKDHAQRAVLMGIEMQKKVFELRHEWRQYGHDLGIGIGINTGYMTVGNIGSDIHMDYTVIGNQVNVAARLESLAKPGQILISQRTYSRIQDLVDVEEMGEVVVKGIRSPVMTYCIKIPETS